jgi:uncharacterized protein DUF2252
VTSFVLAAALAALAGCGSRPLRADRSSLAEAAPELIDRLRGDPFNYFRFTNHEWTARVCETFSGVLATQPIVQLHGDAHVEQYALMGEAWGLDDFDDSARGPALVDIVRFLGSIDLAARHRGWTRNRDQLVERFFAGYRRGLSDPLYQPPEPDIVRSLRTQPVPTREAFLASAETQMAPLAETTMNGVIEAMEVFARLVQLERSDLPDGYFNLVRAGWLHIGVGSAASKKILIRVSGPSSDPEDDVVLEAKALRALDDTGCLEVPKSRPTIRVIVGNRQLGRLKHNILAAGPEFDLGAPAIGGEQLRNWWLRSWEPSYREVRLDDLRSVEDLSAIVFDSGVQLGSGSIQGSGAAATTLRGQSLDAVTALERRIREQADTMVRDLLQGWRELGSR